TTGRGNLDAVRQWVTDAANSVPPGKQRDELLMKIANSGLGQVSEIVQTSNDANNTIRDNMNRLKPEFQAIGFGEGKGEGDPILEDLKERSAEEEARKRAEQDVQDTLAGDQEAAGRVDDVLSGIQPGQALTPEQKSYLSQMQAQQHGMSVDELTTAEERLGENRDVIANSWQLMSNKDVEFTRTELTPDKLDDPTSGMTGGFEQLPQSVQEAINEADQIGHRGGGEEATLLRSEELTQISEIVKHGDDQFKHGTELDRGLMTAADAVLDRDESIRPHSISYVAESLFEAVAPDHQAISEHILSDRGDDFLGDVDRLNWTDDGKAAAGLFAWTNESHQGPEAEIAAQTAEKYARHIADDAYNLLHTDTQTLGERNPELVKGYSHGLVPFIPEIAGLSIEGSTEPFSKAFDSENAAEFPNAKNLYAVIASQQDAFQEWTTASDALILARTVDWATSVDPGSPINVKDVRLTDSSILTALQDVGTARAAQSSQFNAEQFFEQRKSNYEDIVKAFAVPGNLLPHVGPIAGWQVEAIGSGMQSSIIGTEPRDLTTTIAPMGHHESTRFALNALLSAGHDIGPLPKDWTREVAVDQDNPAAGTRPEIRTLDELTAQRVDYGDMERVMQDSIDQVFGRHTGYMLSDSIKSTYDDITRNPDVQPANPKK
ncbi:TPR repeat region-containing protein, partial [Mycolicibacterium arseniciresistens]